MIPTLFRLQSVDSGAYAAPCGARQPFVCSADAAAVYALPDATRRAGELFDLTGERCRLVGAELEWDFEPSVDIRPT